MALTARTWRREPRYRCGIVSRGKDRLCPDSVIRRARGPLVFWSTRDDAARMTQRAQDIDLPEPFSRLAAFIRAGAGDAHLRLVERALGVAELASWLGGSATSEPARELGYAGHPFEVIPFAWQGGDALVYALLRHDPSIPPCFVSYAPGDDPAGPVWLADDAETALRHLLAVTLRVARQAAHDGSQAPNTRTTTRARRWAASQRRWASRSVRRQRS